MDTQEQSNSADAAILEQAREHMQMIQENVGRMATTSAVLKGFAATMFAAFAALSYNDINIRMLVVSILPVVGFFLLDTYYLTLEKKYRYFYEQVRTGAVAADFSMSVAHIDAYSCSWIKALCSRSITLFYGPLAAAYASLIICKTCGI